jgi:hypothetical protein
MLALLCLALLGAFATTAAGDDPATDAVRAEDQQRTIEATHLRKALADRKKVIESLNQKLLDADRRLDEFHTKLTTDYKEMEARLRAKLAEDQARMVRLERRVQELFAETERLQRRVDRLEEINAALREQIRLLKGGKPRPTTSGHGPGTATVLGEIIPVGAGDRVVYVTRPARGGPVVGMTLRVFPAAQTAFPAADEGKGLIEVIRLGRTLAECRIIRRGGTLLHKGDLAVTISTPPKPSDK